MKSVKLMGAALAACALMAGTAFAAPREAAPTAFDPIAHQRVVEVSEQLRCLVCQNQSIADSNAELAVDLRNQVIEQVKAGKTNKEIVDYMVERYGDFVLYKPPFKANTVILWLGPGLIHNGVTMLEMSDGTMRFVQDASILDFMEYYRVSLMNPTVLIGVFIGAMMSFLFCGLTMNAVGRAAQSMVEEVRRQFREIKGILTGEGTPDYARCVAISTRGAQREMLFPSLLAIAAPVVVGLVFGVAGVMGLLVGGLSSGFVLAVFMANAGGAWDNAKKMVEEGHFGGKGSDCHRATVVGDTVGDPFKDTSGPSLNILIKLMSMVAIVMAGLTVAFHLF